MAALTHATTIFGFLVLWGLSYLGFGRLFFNRSPHLIADIFAAILALALVSIAYHVLGLLHT